MSIAVTETYGEHPATMSEHHLTIDAAAIPPVTRREAYALARAEYTRLLALVESLSGDDWHRPTACTLWDVKSMVAHIAGALAGHASRREFARQYSPLSHRPYRGRFKEPVDYVNAVQVDDRAARTTEELIAEMRAAGPKALRTRYRVPKPVRLLRVPAGPFGLISAEYLLDTIYPRDMWMHRLDISRATGREMVTTPEHDGR
ncbi:MAG TPA: maleylpyruvate isomerase family mycothiol-dependent enzyme, partial [Chloroflexia bacterium]|nr:maleylpyruvate isomerase family mycothiol-dependent enzyme [Chloroflexia bacterium]